MKAVNLSSLIWRLLSLTFWFWYIAAPAHTLCYIDSIGTI
jgi:hypothetical protein